MTIGEITSTLRSSGYRTPNDIKNIFGSIEQYFSVPSLILSQGTQLYRARIVDDITEVKHKNHLSYTPAKLNTTYKRASTPNNTMFYGITGNTHKERLMGCLSEVCECLREPNPSHKHYNVVIGIWELKEDLCIPQILDIDGNNKSDDFQNADEYCQMLSLLNDVGSEIAEFWRFMNKQFTKNVKHDDEYWISAIFTEWLVNRLPYGGVIYESVQSVDTRLKNNHCVALTPNTVDKYLKFVEAQQFDFDFDGTTIVLEPPKILNIDTD